MRGRFIAAVVFLAACLLAGTAWSQTRGLTIRLKASEAADAGAVELYKASHALVIGIDKYTGGWPRLSNAVRNAELVAAEFRKRDFDVTLKTNLVSAELERALGLSRDERRHVQRALSVLGFDTGGVDGILGRRSRDAISA